MTIIKEIQSVYPQAKINSIQKALDYIHKTLPVFVYRYIVFSNSLKSCSGISPAFAEQASNDGFATITVGTGNHFYNVILCDGENLAVDLSAIQFKLNDVCDSLKFDDKDPFGEIRGTKLLMKKVIDNPFEAARVWKTNNDNGMPPTGNNLMGPVKPIDFKHWENIWKTEHPNFKLKEDPDVLHRQHPIGLDNYSKTIYDNILKLSYFFSKLA